MAEARHRMSIARHKWADNPGYSAKKDVVHALRYLSFAIQVAETGKVSHRVFLSPLSNPLTRFTISPQPIITTKGLWKKRHPIGNITRTNGHP